MYVSVIIPAFNRANYVAQTLNSIICQDLSACEIIVVNDGSTDETAAVVEAYRPRIKLITIPNGGPSGARAAGVRVSTGQYIAFCDSDDVWRPDHLSRLARLLESAPFAFSNFVSMRSGKVEAISQLEYDKSGFWRSPGRLVYEDAFIIDEPILPKILQYQVIWPSCTAMSRDFYDRIGGCDPAFGRNVVEDFEFTLRCTRQGPVGVDTRPTVQIRKHEDNYSGDWIRRLKGEIAILKHARSNHELRPEWLSGVEREIIERSRVGIDRAFAAKNMVDVRHFAQNVPPAGLGWKHLAKRAVAMMPQPIANMFCDILTRHG